MAQRRIVLTNIQKQSTGDIIIYGVFWLDAPANRIVLLPNFKSVVPAVATVSWGITATELAALQAGTIVEQAFDSGNLNSSLTVNQIQNGLQAALTAAQTALTNSNPPNKFIGSSFDGTTWTAAP